MDGFSLLKSEKDFLTASISIKVGIFGSILCAYLCNIFNARTVNESHDLDFNLFFMCIVINLSVFLF